MIGLLWLLEIQWRQARPVKFNRLQFQWRERDQLSSIAQTTTEWRQVGWHDRFRLRHETHQMPYILPSRIWYLEKTFTLNIIGVTIQICISSSMSDYYAYQNLLLDQRSKRKFGFHLVTHGIRMRFPVKRWNSIFLIPAFFIIRVWSNGEIQQYSLIHSKRLVKAAHHLS